MKRAIRDLKKLGGAAWVGDSSGKFPGFGNYCADIKRVYGAKEYAKWNAARKKYGITDQMVKISSITFVRLMNAGLIELVPGVPAAFRLTPGS